MAKQFDTDKIFMWHPPFGNQLERYLALRAKAKELAEMMQMFAPPSRELSTALSKVQEATMWVSAAIAINEVEPVPEPVVADVLGGVPVQEVVVV